MNDVIKIDSKELEILDKTNKDIERLNSNILVMRKKQLYGQLAEGSSQRVKLLKRITQWIEMLEVKIFDSKTIEEMDIDKAIALFKYIATLQIKALAQTDKLEEVLGKYLSTDALSLQQDINNGKVDLKGDMTSMKKEIMATLSSILMKNSSDAEVVKKETIVKNDEYQKLENDIENIDDIDSLPNVDIE